MRCPKSLPPWGRWPEGPDEVPVPRPPSLPLQGKVSRLSRDGRGRLPFPFSRRRNAIVDSRFHRLHPHLHRRAAQRQPLLNELLHLLIEGVLPQHLVHEVVQRIALAGRAALHAHPDVALFAPHQPRQLRGHGLGRVQPIQLPHGLGVGDGRRGHHVPGGIAAPIQRLPHEDALIIELPVRRHAPDLEDVPELPGQARLRARLLHKAPPPLSQSLKNLHQIASQTSPFRAGRGPRRPPSLPLQGKVSRRSRDGRGRLPVPQPTPQCRMKSPLHPLTPNTRSPAPAHTPWRPNCRCSSSRRPAARPGSPCPGPTPRSSARRWCSGSPASRRTALRP